MKILLRQHPSTLAARSHHRHQCRHCLPGTQPVSHRLLNRLTGPLD